MPTQEQGMVTIDDGYDCLKQCFNEKISNWLWLGASEHKKWISRAFIYSRPTSDNNPVFLSPLSFSVYLALWTIVDWSIWARKWTDIDTITSVLSYCNVEISTELLALTNALSNPIQLLIIPSMITFCLPTSRFIIQSSLENPHITSRRFSFSPNSNQWHWNG